MNQMTPGTIVRMLPSRELGTIIRHSMITDIRKLGAKERNALFYAHYMIISVSGIRHVHQARLEHVWSPD
jgi:hypothetical protein